MSPRQLSIKLDLPFQTWMFDVRVHHSEDPRFEGIARGGNRSPIEFVLIRSVTGKWMISGIDLPSEIAHHTREIVNAVEEALMEQNSI